MTSLSGSFRVGRREVQLMNEMRARGKTVQCISNVLGRSKSTIAAWTQPVVDNRKASPKNRSIGRQSWMGSIAILRMKCSLFLKGLVATTVEALDCRVVPLAAVQAVLRGSENSDADQDTEPA